VYLRGKSGLGTERVDLPVRRPPRGILERAALLRAWESYVLLSYLEGRADRPFPGADRGRAAPGRPASPASPISSSAGNASMMLSISVRRVWISWISVSIAAGLGFGLLRKSSNARFLSLISSASASIASTEARTMAAQAWNCCCVRVRTSSRLGAESCRSRALPRRRMRTFGNRNLQIMVSLLPPVSRALVATLAALVLPPELLSLRLRQVLSHCQQHRHPCLAEVGAGLLEQIDLGHDPLVVVPIVGKESVEVGSLLLDVRFEVVERLLIPGEDLLETPHLVLGQFQLTANVPPLPELAVVPSQTARPVRSGLGGHAWRDEDAGQYQAAHEVLHAVFPTDAETLHLLYRRATWGEGRRPFSRRRGRSHRGPRPRSHRFPEGAGRRRRPARSRSRSRRRRRCSSRRPGRRAEPPGLGRAARVPPRRRRPRRIPPTRPSPARAGASLPQ